MFAAAVNAQDEHVRCPEYPGALLMLLHVAVSRSEWVFKNVGQTQPQELVYFQHTDDDEPV